MKRCLIVEDDEQSRSLLQYYLNKEFQCEFALNGRQGLELYNQAFKNKTNYSCIISDISMPEMDGLTFLRLVRESEQKKKVAVKVPIFLTTAHKGYLGSAADLGCDGFLEKPFNPDELLQLINRRLQYRY